MYGYGGAYVYYTFPFPKATFILGPTFIDS